MGRLQIIEVVSYSEFSIANYRCQNGDYYEVLYSKNFTSKKVGEKFEIISVERFGETLCMNHPVYKEINNFLNQKHSKQATQAA